MSTAKILNNGENTIVSSRNTTGKISQSYWVSRQLENKANDLVAFADRWNLLQQYGDFTLAYAAAVQPKIQYFGDANGFIAYGQRWGYQFVLGDPMAPADRRAKLIKEFIHAFPHASFCQVSRDVAEILQELRFFVNEMGVDTSIDLKSFSFKGKDREWLRYAANWISRRDFKIVEQSMSEIDSKAVESVSESWRKTRKVKRKEVRFLNRPMAMHDEVDVRRFFLYDSHSQLLAFVFFDPLYRDGKIIGCVASVKRRHPNAPPYAEHAIMKHAIETFQREKIGELRLGLSPFAWIEDTEFRVNWWLSKQLRLAFDSWILNRLFYNVRGHAEYKRRYRGIESKVYFASPVVFNEIRLMALIGLMGIA